MPRLLVVVLAMLALALAVACGGDDGPNTGDDATAPASPAGGSGGGDEQDVRDAVIASYEALIGGDSDAFYDSFSADFHDRCPRDEFDRIIAFARIFLGDLEEQDPKITVGAVRFEGQDKAFAETTVELEDGAISEGSGDGFASFWVREDGEWRADTDDPSPCDFGDGVFGGDSEPDATPRSGPGASRAEPLPLGVIASSGDLAVTVLDVDFDAEDAINTEENSFNDPPAPGNRFVLIRVRVRNAGDGDEVLAVSTSDFRLTGSRNLLYDTFDDETSCGFFDGQLDAEMFPGGSDEGLVCFQVPRDETGLLLVVQPFFSFDDGDRVYLSLE